MLLSEHAETAWNSKTKNYYVNRGYKFTKMGDPLVVSVDDLTKGSSARVKIRCDYCGREYDVAWYTYLALKKKTLQTDCCGNTECIERKAHAALIAKYGDAGAHNPVSTEKRNRTNLKRYGAENVFAADVIKDRIVKTNIRRYGVPYAQQNDNVRRKTINTCREKYGVNHYIELYKGKFIKENSPCWKGGVEHSRVERATNEYIQWRKSVFARDAYTCCKCGAKNGNDSGYVELHAHHILNWRDHEGHRYNVDNGITFCSKCHMKFHSVFGKRNNTLEQVEEFLELDKKIC